LSARVHACGRSIGARRGRTRRVAAARRRRSHGPARRNRSPPNGAGHAGALSAVDQDVVARRRAARGNPARVPPPIEAALGIASVAARDLHRDHGGISRVHQERSCRPAWR
jgi:hypothetical protein